MDECGIGWEELKGEGKAEKPDERRIIWEGYREEEVWESVHYLWRGRWRWRRYTRSDGGEEEVLRQEDCEGGTSGV